MSFSNPFLFYKSATSPNFLGNASQTRKKSSSSSSSSPSKSLPSSNRTKTPRGSEVARRPFLQYAHFEQSEARPSSSQSLVNGVSREFLDVQVSQLSNNTKERRRRRPSPIPQFSDYYLAKTSGVETLINEIKIVQ